METSLVRDVRDDLVNLDAHQRKQHVFATDLGLMVIAVHIWLVNLDAEHTNEWGDQHMNLLLLQHNEQLPDLQQDEGVIDHIDGGRDQKGNDPPIVLR